jgi:hypothetical protein
MVTRAADTARQYATEVRDKLANTAESYTTAAVNYADETKRTVLDHSERLASQAQSSLKSTMDDVLNYQPLAVAFVGVAAGAAVAAAFPATKAERRALGPTADRLSDVAASATKQLSKAAAAAGDRLKTAAEERGISADGFKEVVSEVAGTFESTISGEQTIEKSSAGKESVQDRIPSGGGMGMPPGQGGTRRPGSASDYRRDTSEPDRSSPADKSTKN